MDKNNMGNFLIIGGIVFIIVGVVVNLVGKYGLPRLPGDIYIKKDNFTFYFPLVTSLLISLLLTFLLNLLRK